MADAPAELATADGQDAADLPAPPDAPPDLPDLADSAADGAALPDEVTPAQSDADDTLDAEETPDTDETPDADAAAEAADDDVTDAAADAMADAGADTAPDAAPEDAVVDVWQPPTGGKPGTGCFGKDGTVACSLDGKFRVECIDGAWTAIQHCSFGICTASLAAGGGVITTCGVPKSKLNDLNAACARYNSCFGPLSHEQCVRANLSPAAFVAGIADGAASKVQSLAFAELGNNLACAAKAKNCTALAECLYYFGGNKCATSTIGCENDVAYSCVAGAPLATNCKNFGMVCAKNAAAQCFKGAPCKTSDPPTCTADVWSGCLTISGYDGYTQKVDCGALPGGCNKDATTAANACSGAPVTPCKMAELAPICKANAAVSCIGGDTVTAPCPPGTLCALEDQFSLFNPVCPENQACSKILCSELGACAMQSKCNGSEVWFCEAKQPASFECKEVGMTCTMTSSGPACQ